MSDTLEVVRTLFPDATIQKDYRGYYGIRHTDNYVDFLLCEHSGSGFTANLKFCGRLIGEWKRYRNDSLSDVLELIRLELSAIRDYLVDVTNKD